MIRRVLFALLFVPLLFAQAPLTIVSDTLYSADGSPMNGNIIISWTQFQNLGVTVGSGRKSCPVVNGSLTCSLVPTVGSSPTTVYAVYTIANGTSNQTAWNVPTSPSLVNLAAVTVPFVPALNITVLLSQLQQNGATNGQVLGWNGSAWVPVSGGEGNISSVFGRTGTITAGTGDYTFSQISGTASLSQLAQGGAVATQVLGWTGSTWAPTNQVVAVTSLFGRAGSVTAQSGDYSFNQISGNVSMAQIAQSGASTGQALMWTGSAWAPGSTVTYGTTSGTAAQGNDSRITGAEQTANKDATSGYAGLTGGLLKLAEFPAPFNAFQGNGSKVQLATGSTTSGDCPEYDANGNLFDSGGPCNVSSGVTSVSATGNLASSGGSSPTITMSATPGFTKVSTGTSPPADAWFTGNAGVQILGDGTCTGTAPASTSAIADCAGTPSWITASGTTQLLQGSTSPVSVSALGSCSSANEGQRKGVIDSNAASFTVGIGGIATGGGSTHAPVYCDGTNWRIG